MHGDSVDLVLEGVAKNSSDSVYVLWQQTDRGISSAGAFDVRSDGLTVVNTGLKVDGATLKRLMVTREAGRTAPATAAGPLVFDSGD